MRKPYTPSTMFDTPRRELTGSPAILDAWAMPTVYPDAARTPEFANRSCDSAPALGKAASIINPMRLSECESYDD